AAAAASTLKDRGIAAAVYNCPSLRPFDTDAVIAAVAACGGRAITVEEHSVHGGLGSLVAEALAEAGALGTGCILKRLGIPEGEFSVAGPRGEIRAYYGFDAAGIIQKAEGLVRKSPRVTVRA
ncbi:MAG: transketolase C-terminal domain-containing protein, partial [Spirochaetota bacterium]